MYDEACPRLNIDESPNDVSKSIKVLAERPIDIWQLIFVIHATIIVEPRRLSFVTTAMLYANT